MPLMPFIVATGFLATILLVWGQLWASAYSGKIFVATVYLGQIWTFLAVLLALIAFALAGLSWSRKCYKAEHTVGRWPIGLLVATLIMTGVNVGQSLVSVFTKFLKPILLSEPLIEFATSEARCGGIIFLCVVAAIIIVMSLLGTKWRSLWIWEIVFLIILGGAIYVLFLFNPNVFAPHVLLNSR